MDLAPEAPAAVDIQALIQTGCVGSKLGSTVRVLKLKLNSLPPEYLTTQEGKNQSSSQASVCSLAQAGGFWRCNWVTVKLYLEPH